MKRIWIPEAPYIHRRRLIEGELRAPKARIQGIMTAELVHARTGLIARRLTFPNLVTDSGLNGIGTTTIAALTNYCGVGTGNSAPANAQTSLDTEVVRTNATGGIAEVRGVAGDLTYTWWKRTRSFTTAQANATLAEIGFFSASSAGTMFARQLIKDELGAPTTITKTSEYELRVTYEVRFYAPADVEYSALIDGVSQTIRTRPARLLNNGGTDEWAPEGGATEFSRATIYTGSLGVVTGGPAGTQAMSDNTGANADAYVNLSLERTANFRYSAAIANGVNYKSFLLGYGYLTANMIFQHEILGGATIIKNNTQRFDIYGQISWARYVP